MEKVLLETVTSYNEYIKKIPAGSLLIANLLREDRIVESLNVLKDFTEGVIWLIEVSQLFEKNDLLTQLNIEKIHAYLNEINEGLEIKDYNLVADLFEYEIAPFFGDVLDVTVASN